MSSIIHRQDLETLLSKSQYFAVTLLIAPAGSGKTTLLDQWQAAHAQDLIARINLRHNQKSIQQVLKYMLSEIRNQVELFDAPIFNLFSDQTSLVANTDVYVNSVIQVLNSIAQPITLVVDDFHLMDDKYAQQFVLQLFEKIPKHVHFIISSRHHPKLNFSRLKLADNFLQIDHHDLMLAEPQIQELAQHVLGEKLKNNQLEKLNEVTEGWCAGVKIALLAMREHGEQGLTMFNGGQPDMMEYFATEVYQHLPENIKQFFLVSSLLERFNIEICHKLFKHEDSGSIVTDLLSRSAFIIEEKTNLGWYRYHSLLIDFLNKKRNEYYSESQQSDLHKISMQACMALGQYEMAVSHGARCQDRASYFDALISACEFWLKLGEFTHIVKALDELPEDQLLAHDQLAVMYAYSLILSRRFTHAQFFLSLLIENPSSLDTSPRPESFFGDVSFLRLSLKLLQQDIEKLDKQTIVSLLDESYLSEARIFSLIIAAYFELQNGDLKEAMRISIQAKTVMAKKGYVFLESYADLLIALCDRYMGRGVESITYISNLYQKSNFKKGGLPWVSLSTAMVVVYYEQNKLANSKELCETLLPHLTHTCVTDVISTIYLSLSRLLFIEEDYKKSQRILDQLDRILILGNYSRFCSQNLCEVVRQAYLERDYPRLNRLADKHKLRNVDVTEVDLHGRFNEECERKVLAAFYVLCSNEDYQIAKKLMQELAHRLDNLSLISRTVVARCNLAVLAYKQGNQRFGVDHLKKIIAEYSITAISRTTFDEAPGLDEVFQYGLSNDTLVLPELFKYIFKTLLTDAELESASDHVEQLPLYHLTEKELIIYNLLSSGLSNADISAQSNVALSTTKWHLKNIYQKLGVSNRAQAIARKPSVMEY